nr:GNAT family N-acetyltransferase [Streptomyces sp. NRRL B-3229]
MAQQTELRGGGASLRPTDPFSVLDNAVWAALDGPHALPHSLKGMGGAPIAERVGRAARYPDDVYAFAAVAAGIRERGDTPFLHAAADNTNAIRLYESLGFTLRRRSPILLVRSPGTSGRGSVL